MELYKEMLAKVLESQTIEVTFPHLQIDASKIIELRAYQALQKIKAIIENDDLSDFMCIEKIVCLLEDLGTDCGNRHDFG